MKYARRRRGDTMSKPRHIVLTSHSRPGSNYFTHPLGCRRRPKSWTDHWQCLQCHASECDRAHSGSYSVYRAVSVAVGRLDPDHVPDLTNTSPVTKFPHPQWSDPKIVSFDPWGHVVTDEFAEQISEGFDIRPSIAVTQPSCN